MGGWSISGLRYCFKTERSEVIMDKNDVKVAIWTDPADTELNFKFWSPETDLYRTASITWDKNRPADLVASDIKYFVQSNVDQLISEVNHTDQCHCPWEDRDRKKDKKIGTKKGRSVHPFSGHMRDWEYDLYVCSKCGKEWLDAPLIG